MESEIYLSVINNVIDQIQIQIQISGDLFILTI